MIPLRLVIDTNIVVSAALKPNGLQRTVLLGTGESWEGQQICRRNQKYRAQEITCDIVRH